MNPSDEIKARLDIVDVIREYIQLKPAGMNFSARCPFHNEKSGSFMVSPDKQIWHCFGCGKGGDVFSFVMEMEGLSFVEVLRELAPKAGVELKAENNRENSFRNRLLDIMAEATRYYHKTLLEHPLAQSARDYLDKRGLTDEIIEEWQIGYSLDDWEDIVKYLGSKGYKDSEIFAAGLSTKKEDTNRYYNRFRGRIMFPINDVNANPVAFTARVSPEKEATEKMGKYINSPQTAIYDKSRILFGLDKAKQAIKQAGLVVLVEGQMDVITSHQFGYKNVVASSGTALTEGQVTILKRFTDTLALAFDSDQAGQLAIERGDALISQHAYKIVQGQDKRGRIKEYLEPSLTGSIILKVIEIPNGKDPDECIRTDAAAWEAAVKQAKPIMQHYFDKTLKDLDTREVEGKRQAVKILLPAIGKLGNKIEQEAWIRKLAEILQTSENLLFEAMPKRKIEAAAEAPKAPEKREKSRAETLSELVLALVLYFPENFSFLVNRLELQWLNDHEAASLYKNLVIYYNQFNEQVAKELSDIWGSNDTLAENHNPGSARTLDFKGLRPWLRMQCTPAVADQQADLADRLALLAEKEYYQLSESEAKAEIIRILRELRRLYITNELKRVEADLAKAEREGQADVATNLLGEFKILSEELRDVTL